MVQLSRRVGCGALGHLRGPAELNICLRVSGFGPFEPSGQWGHFSAWIGPLGPFRGPRGVSGLEYQMWVGCAFWHLRDSAEFNICRRGSGFGPFEPSGQWGHFCAKLDPWGPFMGPPRGDGAPMRVGGWGVPLGTSATLQHSIFVGECRGLDHSNRLRKAHISIIFDILKALKMEFHGFLTCFGTCFFAVL
jgi:hypothetical protein